jgi:threonine/homoserine/homoserine lactone efflux protein
MLIKLLLQFIIGIGVGVYGYIIPSFINLGVFQLSMSHSLRQLRKVIIIISLVEIPYCFVCMSGMEWLIQQKSILLYIRWLIVGVLFLMAIITWIDATKKHKEVQVETKQIEGKQLNRLLFYAIFNPFQLSAWAIWGIYFVEKTWFEWNASSIFVFSVGASIGVFIILWVYAKAGQQLVTYFSTHRKKIDYAIGLILFVLGVVQLVRNIYM